MFRSLFQKRKDQGNCRVRLGGARKDLVCIKTLSYIPLVLAEKNKLNQKKKLNILQSLTNQSQLGLK